MVISGHQRSLEVITWVESIGRERRIASTTSASVTRSHLHTIFFDGSFSFQNSVLLILRP